MDIVYSPEQLDLIEKANPSKIWVSGPAGTGKTEVGAARLQKLLERGISAEAVLVVVAQRALGAPYSEAWRACGHSGGVVDVLTIGGLAKRTASLFWPLLAGMGGFANPGRPPVFLNLETAQYHMARIVQPLIEQQRFFDGVTLARNRIYSQILDNLNKAAVVGFSHTEISLRLKAAWVGDESQHFVYDHVQDCANRFREYCLAHNFLDFSLQMDLFAQHAWADETCRDYLLNRYRYILVDNVEELTPASHDVLEQWTASSDGCLLLQDQDAGFRRFLGADPQSAKRLQANCDVRVNLQTSFVSSQNIQAFESRLRDALEMPSLGDSLGNPSQALQFQPKKFHPEMVAWVAEQVASLIHDQNTSPNEIVILAPYLSDALRFALRTRLEALDVPVQSHRPSRMLKEEPATTCLLTWASLLHPNWGFWPTAIDVAHALQQSIANLDLVRAQLLAETLYSVTERDPQLHSFDRLRPEMQQRVTFVLGAHYERLRNWLENYGSRESEPLDLCLRRLFGEVLSQKGFGFYQDFDRARVAANLIDSIKNFRWVAEAVPQNDPVPLGQEYLSLVRDGVISAQYIGDWKTQSANAVLLAPAYTFLTGNRAVDVQFWLNVGSTGWWERVFQPLTHPHVLSRQWDLFDKWTDTDEVNANTHTLFRLVVGLLRRCRRKVYLGLSELDEQGLEQRGPLLGIVQQMLRGWLEAGEIDDV